MPLSAPAAGGVGAVFAHVVRPHLQQRVHLRTYRCFGAIAGRLTYSLDHNHQYQEIQASLAFVAAVTGGACRFSEPLFLVILSLQ